MIICTGRFRQCFASAVGNRTLNPSADAYLPFSCHEYRSHELILNSSIHRLNLHADYWKIGKFRILKETIFIYPNVFQYIYPNTFLLKQFRCTRCENTETQL